MVSRTSFSELLKNILHSTKSPDSDNMVKSERRGEKVELYVACEQVISDRTANSVKCIELLSTI